MRSAASKPPASVVDSTGLAVESRADNPSKRPRRMATPATPDPLAALSLTVVTCSAKVRRLHPGLAQKNPRTLNLMTTGRPAIAASSIRRTYRLWTPLPWPSLAAHLSLHLSPTSTTFGSGTTSRRRHPRIHARRMTRTAYSAPTGSPCDHRPEISSCWRYGWASSALTWTWKVAGTIAIPTLTVTSGLPTLADARHP